MALKVSCAKFARRWPVAGWARRASLVLACMRAAARKHDVFAASARRCEDVTPAAARLGSPLDKDEPEEWHKTKEFTYHSRRGSARAWVAE